MKRLISFVLVLAMVLTSVAAFAAPSATKHDVQNNIFIEGKVGAYEEGEELLLTITKGEEVVYVGNYADAVKIDGSYAIKFKHTGDLSDAYVNVKYAGEDVTSGAVNATSTSQIMEADVFVTDDNDRTFDMEVNTTMPTHVFEKDYKYSGVEYSTKEHTYTDGYEFAERKGLKAVVNLKNKFAYEGKMEVLVAAYGENDRLLDCKKADFKAEYAEDGALQVFETVAFDVPEGTVKAKAFCWSSTSNLIPYGKEADGNLEKIDIFCIGDSTGQTWARKWYPQAGWATYIGDYFNEEYVTVTNYCTSGAWAQSILNNPKDKKHPSHGDTGFYGQGDWQEMMADPNFSEGDYVLVCLGVNDARGGDIDGKYSPVEWFRLGYEEMVRQAKDAGVNIIFISATPYALLKSQGNRADFNDAANEVAQEAGVYFLDHASKMIEVFEKSPDTVVQDYYLHRDTFMKSEAEGGYGLTEEEIATHGNESIRGTLEDDGKYYYGGKETDGADETHISIKGANLACQKIVECLKESNSSLRFYVK